MQLSDWEADKLRHLAIRRDVLVVAETGLALPLVMLDTATSVLLVGSPRWTSLLAADFAALQQQDRDGKVGCVLARFEVFLPLLDLRYFDLVFYVAGRGPADAVSSGAGLEAAEEFVQLVASGCRPDAWLAVLTDGADLAAWIVKRAKAMRRRVEMVDQLAVLAPVGRLAEAA